MGFSFRKSIKLGPFRLTGTHRGLSGSVGAGGVRAGRSTTGRRSQSASFKGLSWRESRTSKRSKAPRSEAAPSLLEGPIEVEVVGESHYQEAFLALCGPKTEEGIDVGCVAELDAEPTNPHDPNAVKVLVEAQTVGYVDRASAVHLQPLVIAYQRRHGPCLVRANIAGGWKRRGGDEGQFGIRLWLPEADQFR